jgi:hypothetical protein
MEREEKIRTGEQRQTTHDAGPILLLRSDNGAMVWIFDDLDQTRSMSTTLLLLTVLEILRQILLGNSFCPIL